MTTTEPEQGANQLAVQNPLCRNLAENLTASGDISDFLDVIKELQQDDLQHVACDAVPIICKALGGNDLATTNVSTSADRILSVFVERCEPKEFLVLLIEQAREQWTAEKFLTILPTVRGCIERVPPPRTQSLAFALEAFNKYLENLPLPPAAHYLERKERMLLDADDSVRLIGTAVSAFLDFVDAFIRPISKPGKMTAAKTTPEVTEITNALLAVLNRPLGRLDLLVISEARSDVRRLAERCVAMLARLHPDFVRFLVAEQERIAEHAAANEKNPDADQNGTDETSMSKFDSFVFLAFGDRVAPDSIPCVYSHQFLLELCAPAASLLLEDHDLIPNLHGLYLCNRLLRRIAPETLPIDIIELDALRNLVAGIIKLAVAEKTKELNLGLLRVLSTISNALEPAARAQFLYLMLKIAPRTGGIVGHVIGMITNEITANLDRGKTDKRNYFVGSDLERLLHLVFALPSGEKTDLLENSERIMAALKLLGIVLQRDRMSVNASGIWNLIPMVERNYLRLLRSGIELSRSHYELEIRKTKERGRGERPTGKGFPVGGEAVDLPRRQQLGVLEMAVNTFNMMESVVVSVAGSIETQHKEILVASAVS